jgi:hypothetical protein
VIVVNRQSAFVPTTTSVPFRDAADGASAILLVQKRLVLLGTASLPTCLAFMASLGKAFTTTVLSITKRWKFLLGLQSPTPLTKGHAIPNTFVLDLMEATADQARPHHAKADAGSSGHFAQRQTILE